MDVLEQQDLDLGLRKRRLGHATGNLAGLESRAWPRAKKDRCAEEGHDAAQAKVKAEAGSVGLTADEVATGSPPARSAKLQRRDRGAPAARRSRRIASRSAATGSRSPRSRSTRSSRRRISASCRRRTPIGSPTVIPKVGRFLDPVIAVPDGDTFISPNGMHRLSALGAARREDGRRARDARARDRVPHPRAQHREGAQPQGQGARGHPHGARDRRRRTTRSETDVAFELEQPSLVTIGVCYEKNPRFSGGAYNSVVTQVRVRSRPSRWRRA